MVVGKTPRPNYLTTKTIKTIVTTISAMLLDNSNELIKYQSSPEKNGKNSYFSLKW